jgi:hypothetical protein
MLRRNLWPVPRVLLWELRLMCRMSSSCLLLRQAIGFCLLREGLLAVFGGFGFACCPPFRHALGAFLGAHALLGVFAVCCRVDGFVG